MVDPDTGCVLRFDGLMVWPLIASVAARVAGPTIARAVGGAALRAGASEAVAAGAGQAARYAAPTVARSAASAMTGRSSSSAGGGDGGAPFNPVGTMLNSMQANSVARTQQRASELQSF